MYGGDMLYFPLLLKNSKLSLSLAPKLDFGVTFASQYVSTL